MIMRGNLKRSDVIFAICTAVQKSALKYVFSIDRAPSLTA
jgi:hypothetical protein